MISGTPRRASCLVMYSKGAGGPWWEEVGQLDGIHEADGGRMAAGGEAFHIVHREFRT
jgi:hypothetical protein